MPWLAWRSAGLAGGLARRVCTLARLLAVVGGRGRRAKDGGWSVSQQISCRSSSAGGWCPQAAVSVFTALTSRAPFSALFCRPLSGVVPRGPLVRASCEALRLLPHLQPPDGRVWLVFEGPDSCPSFFHDLPAGAGANLHHSRLPPLLDEP